MSRVVSPKASSWIAFLVVCAIALFCAIDSPLTFAMVVGTLVLLIGGGAVAAKIAAARNAARFANAGSKRTAARVERGEGLGVDELARRLGRAAAELRAFAPNYRDVTIPKRRGGGVRKLLVPDDATKSLQRAILWKLLSGLRSHPAATGFERGKSIVENAMPHAGRAVVVRMDVVDFFPSTSAARVLRMFQWVGWDREAAELLTRLTTHGDGLPQGAPTSPRLSNLVNRGLDRAITARIGALRGRYSRYADDISVSFPEDRPGCVERTRARVKDELGRYGYEMHVRKKLSVRRAHQRQVVTGLVVNAKVALPRELRRKLRAARHHRATGREATWTDEQLRGWAAFEKMVRDQGAPPAPDADGTTPNA